MSITDIGRIEYDSGRIHKACRTNSHTQRGCDGIFLQDYRQHHRPDGSEKEGG